MFDRSVREPHPLASATKVIDEDVRVHGVSTALANAHGVILNTLCLRELLDSLCAITRAGKATVPAMVATIEHRGWRLVGYGKDDHGWYGELESGNNHPYRSVRLRLLIRRGGSDAKPNSQADSAMRGELPPAV